ncbi:hypothetical protein [Natronolimnohabitans innermongolicus]|uniref:Uncharacterized protein n=1 Tax=Natronolimnohabitans innermongolicus JCM 12255 TaxID=1227499 RepID=L9X215_9EURY|nr:hypothetical protein [Natronolimnohabitans innermongolicus]ELY55770.1 hypothetical protein C493_10907 [Natronolimnohabitans innermongolicus JCM 12255]
MNSDSAESTSASAQSSGTPLSSRSAIVVAVVLALLGSSLLARTAVVDPVISVVFAVAGVGFGTVIVLRHLRRRGPRDAADRDASNDGDGDDAESDVWNAIPSNQYAGRHVESGGLARGEQEQALSDVQERAEEIERRR